VQCDSSDDPLFEGTYSDWHTDDPRLHEKDLEDLIYESKLADDKPDKPEELGLIGVRILTPGLRTILDDKAEEFRITYSELTRSALKLGAAIIEADQRMRALMAAYKETRSAAMNSGNKAALTRLDQAQPFNFVSAEPYRTSFSTLPWVKALLANLSHASGLYENQLAVIAILTALLTLPDERGYRTVIREELDNFWETVLRRTAILRIE